MANRTISIVVTEDDYQWLTETALKGPYHFPSTYARYLLAEIIRTKKDEGA